jgi:catalase
VNPAAAPDRAIFDLVGHNIPVFFIPDAIKFPDLVHSVKMEPDRGYPQADSAHDTCCTFVSLIPESMHIIMWAMSDRATPRSFRLIEGFSVNTFRLVGNKGKPTFVNFHWRQKLGMQSVIWDEAVKINGPTPTFIVVICLRRSQAATIRMGIRRSVVR